MRRRGFTMVEVMIGLVILGAVILGMATSTGRFMRQVSESDLENAALQLAEDRIQMVMLDPDYQSLEAKYEGTESDFPTLEDFTRETLVTQVGGPGQNRNHKRVMVSVNGPGLDRPIQRSATVAAP